MYDLPLLRDGDYAYGFYATTTPNLSPTWSSATLFKSYDGGTNYVTEQTSNTRGTIGMATSTLGTFTGGNVFDEANTLTVYLTAGSGALSSATELAVLNGANMALIGSEIVQFKNATLTATRTYTLSGFLRGRRGTEYYISSHAASEAFVLLSTAINVNGPYSELFVPRTYKAITAGKTIDWGSAVDFTNEGIALQPYSPCQLGGGRDASGNLTLNWTRRTRVGGEWMDYVDALLSEDAESYLVTIYSSVTYATEKRSIFVSSPTYDYSSASQTTDFGSNQSTVYWTVVQINDLGTSRPTRGAT